MGIGQLAAVCSGRAGCSVGADDITAGFLACHRDAASVAGALGVIVLHLQLGAVSKLQLQVFALLGGHDVGGVFDCAVHQVLHSGVLAFGEFEDLFLAHLDGLDRGLGNDKLFTHGWASWWRGG